MQILPISSRFPAWGLLAGWLVLAPPATASTPAPANPTPTSFAAQVEAHFEVWDYNRDGYLSYMETSQLVPVMGIRGDEAAALAAIHRIQLGRKWTQASFSRDLLLTGDPATGLSLPWFEANYRECVAHIRGTERVLFPKDGPSLRAFHQGALGDCYFVAVVGAVVDRYPSALSRLIRQGTSGSFDVVFPGRQAVRVRHLSDAEIALGSSVGGQGLWLNVLEKAFGQMAEEELRLEGGVREDAIDAVGQGGQTTRSLRLFTGREARTVPFRPDGATAVPGESDAAALVPTVATILKETVRLRRLMTCDSPPSDTTPGLIPSHAYAVLGFDATTGLVHLWNPWGNDFLPIGKPGLESGYAVRGGHFFVPVAEFVRIFAAFHYETAIPARLRW